MSCIVGVKQDDAVWVGADSLSSGGDLTYSRKDRKIFDRTLPSGEPILVGWAGSYRIGQIMQFEMPLEPYTGDPFKYLCVKFAPTLRATLERHKVKSFSGCYEVSMLVALCDELYSIEADFQVGEHHMPFSAAGSGMQAALGALYAVDRKTTLSPQEKLRTALEASEEYAGSVRGPFIFAKLENGKVSYVEDKVGETGRRKRSSK